MTKTDWTPESQPSEEADPLSATGMFLSALGKESDQPQKQPEESAAQLVARLETKQAVASSSPAPASSVSAGAPQGSPGEFTRLFQAAQTPIAAPPQVSAVQTPAPSIEPKPAPSSAPGEFTRILLRPSEAKPADRPPTPLARSIPEPPAPHAAPGSPRMKGFSSGASDSASAEGGFTQFFQSRPPASAPAPTPRVQPFSPPPPPSTSAEEVKWPRQPDSSSVESPVAGGASTPSATNLFASLASGGQRQEEIRQQPVQPLPSFSPAPPAAPSSEESGSVTRLIQRLSEGVRATPQAETPAGPAEPPSPALNSGPGEFTRMISMSAVKASTGAPIQPAAAPLASAPPFSIPAAPPMAMPPAPKPAAAPAPPAFQAPKIEFPPAPVPKPALPAAPAPVGKFQEMVPILLVVITFLLLVLIVLLIFALRAK